MSLHRRDQKAKGRASCVPTVETENRAPAIQSGFSYNEAQSMGSCHERMDGTREVGSLVHSVQLHARIAQQPGLAGGYGVAVPTQMGYTGSIRDEAPWDRDVEPQHWGWGGQWCYLRYLVTLMGCTVMSKAKVPT